ncbi:hypothetical protein C9374_008297 [Naegleria lovaniensis]|uniref:Ternary complex associated domain-containing protein n=1 Tax=Naegleria lovaniensis TaxID=51637 RepID=A0AA88KI98_NAELO|nr:uncharacterized protein C9374_008297 [Naegleria lovaniensis]KAG2378658.1 hypothetical protein C9374_008297 [Naegleria lovaniensis]
MSLINTTLNNEEQAQHQQIESIISPHHSISSPSLLSQIPDPQTPASVIMASQNSNPKGLFISVPSLNPSSTTSLASTHLIFNNNNNNHLSNSSSSSSSNSSSGGPNHFHHHYGSPRTTSSSSALPYPIKSSASASVHSGSSTSATYPSSSPLLSSSVSSPTLNATNTGQNSSPLTPVNNPSASNILSSGDTSSQNHGIASNSENQVEDFGILITCCLQNDFIGKFPGSVGTNYSSSLDYDSSTFMHVGKPESQRLLGSDYKSGPLKSFMSWARRQSSNHLEIIHVRFWNEIDQNKCKMSSHHNNSSSESQNKKHHPSSANATSPTTPEVPYICNGLFSVKGTSGANLVLNLDKDIPNRDNESYVNITNVNAFHGTDLETKIAKAIERKQKQLDAENLTNGTHKKLNVKIGVIGVWTESTIQYLFYELSTRFSHFSKLLSTCSALTASRSRHQHFSSLQQLERYFNVSIFYSLCDFQEWLIPFWWKKTPSSSIVSSGRFLFKQLVRSPSTPQDLSAVSEVSPIPILDMLDSEECGSQLGTSNDENVAHQIMPCFHWKSIGDDLNKLSDVDKEIICLLYHDSTDVVFSRLSGGHSGSWVFKVRSKDLMGHVQATSILKIGRRGPITRERVNFEKVEEILGNNAPQIRGFCELKDRAGIKFAYASMIEDDFQFASSDSDLMSPKSPTSPHIAAASMKRSPSSFRELYMSGGSMSTIKSILHRVFYGVLGRFYDAAVSEQIDLFETYDFDGKGWAWHTGGTDNPDAVRGRIVSIFSELRDCSFFEPRQIPKSQILSTTTATTPTTSVTSTPTSSIEPSSAQGSIFEISPEEWDRFTQEQQNSQQNLKNSTSSSTTSSSSTSSTSQTTSHSPSNSQSPSSMIPNGGSTTTIYIIPPTQQQHGEEKYLIFPGGFRVKNIVHFLRDSLPKIKQGYLAKSFHYVSYVHGDLNGRNIILDTNENVWLIDFEYTERTHILKDVAKLENDIVFEYTPIDSEKELEEALIITKELISVKDLAEPLPITLVGLKSEKLKRAWEAVVELRSITKRLVRGDRNPVQLDIVLLRYALHSATLSSLSIYQRAWAVATACALAQKIERKAFRNDKYHIDWINLKSVDSIWTPHPAEKSPHHEQVTATNSTTASDPCVNSEESHATSKKRKHGRLGISILPGRPSHGGVMQNDLRVLQKNNVKKLVILATQEELERLSGDLIQEAAHMGIETKFIPVQQRHPPPMNYTILLCEWMREAIDVNLEDVVIVSVSGLGRSGTLASCLLLLRQPLAMDAKTSMNAVKLVRGPRVIENSRQAKFVEEFHRIILRRLEKSSMVDFSQHANPSSSTQHMNTSNNHHGTTTTPSTTSHTMRTASPRKASLGNIQHEFYPFMQHNVMHGGESPRKPVFTPLLLSSHHHYGHYGNNTPSMTEDLSIYSPLPVTSNFFPAMNNGMNNTSTVEEQQKSMMKSVKSFDSLSTMYSERK